MQLYPTIHELRKIDALIIDECHEQSMEIDAVVELAEILLKIIFYWNLIPPKKEDQFVFLGGVLNIHNPKLEPICMRPRAKDPGGGIARMIHR